MNRSNDAKPKILVVDDTPENTVAIKKMLESFDCQIDCAYSGNEALSLMLRNEYALVLSDVSMPAMDGFELARLMRQQPETALIPIIFVSAEYKDDINIYKGYEAGAMDYLLKPLDKKILLYKVKILLDLYTHSHKLKPEEAVESEQKPHETHPYHHSSQALDTHDEECSPSVLVVDDREENLIAMKQLLKKLPVNIVLAQSGKEALALLAKQDFSLLLLDVQMPEMDGFEVAEKMNQQFPDNPVPIIFVTAINKEKKHVYQGYQSGAVDYLFKPIESELLLSKVKIFITLHKNRMILNRLLTEKERLLRDLKDKNEQLSYLAFHDSLTMVGNRGGFDHALTLKIANAKRHQRQFSLLLLDVNHFKTINDSYGHDHGDMLLQQMAERMKKCLRVNDYIARVGGDEFAIIVGGIENCMQPGYVAKKLIDTLSQPFDIFNKQIKASISIGIACFPAEDEGELIEHSGSLIRNADIAMYRAKKQRNNAYEFYSKKYSEEHRKRIHFEHMLKFAQERNEFFLVYQPQINLTSRKVVGVEALLRWKHPVKGLISPAEFVPILEETHMIVPVGEWIIRQAFKQALIWKKKNKLDLKISINLSAYQLINQDFKSLIHSLLKEYPVNPEKIEFELTETAVMDDVAMIKDVLFKLNDLNFNISIDDFGTGYSSLSYLKKLPIKTLKIDREFVKDLESNESSAILVKAMLNLAENFGLDVIAEGVELLDQERFLIQQGCQQVQGYLYSKPLLPDELISFINRPPLKK